MRDCISDRTVKELIERLCLAEGWLLKYLLGDGFVVRAAAANVKVFAKKNSLQPEKYFGDLYLIQNINNGHVSFKLYCPKTNQFIWSLDRVYDWNGYVDLKCNTHIFHVGNSMYTFKFPDKRERTVFKDNLNKFMFLQSSKIKS